MDIFVISSNFEVADSLSKFFESEDYKVKGLHKIYEAVERIRKDRPKFVITTYDGGKADVEALFRVCQESRCHFVVISKRQDRNHAIELLDKGAFAYVLEPLNVLELKTIVKRALDNSVETTKRFTFDLLSNLEDGLIISNSDGKVIFVNPRAAEMLGKRISALSGVMLNKVVEKDVSALCANSSESTTQTCYADLIVGPRTLLMRVYANVIHDSKEKALGHCLRFRMKGEVTKDDRRQFDSIKAVASHFLVKATAAEDLSVCKELIARYNLILGSIDELEKPLILDHISVPVEELIELPAIRAKNQVAGNGDIQWIITDPDLRLRCRRKLVEYIFIHALMSGLSARAEGSITVTIKEGEDDIIFRLEDSGPQATEEMCTSLRPNASGRQSEMSLYLSKLLVDHHEGRLRPLTKASGIEISLAKHEM